MPIANKNRKGEFGPEHARKLAWLQFYTVIATDAAVTVQYLADGRYIRHTGTLTADRAMTLSTTGLNADDAGVTTRATRTGSGAFNLSFGGLKNLATGTWAEATWDGSAWYLSAYGAL